MKKLIRLSLISVLVAAHPSVFAHTTIIDQGTENSTLRTFINIPHGCGNSTKPGNLGVEAMSVVFPNAVDSTATRDDTGDSIALSTIISGANDFNGGLVVIVLPLSGCFEKVVRLGRERNPRCQPAIECKCWVLLPLNPTCNYREGLHSIG